MFPQTRPSRSRDGIVSRKSADSAPGRRRRTQLTSYAPHLELQRPSSCQTSRPCSLHEQAGTGVTRTRGGSVFKKTARAERDGSVLVMTGSTQKVQHNYWRKAKR